MVHLSTTSNKAWGHVVELINPYLCFHLQGEQGLNGPPGQTGPPGPMVRPHAYYMFICQPTVLLLPLFHITYGR